MRLDFGGVAKGFTVDAICYQIQEAGIASFLIDGGGDIRLGEPPPGKNGWEIEMPDGSMISLANKAIATSGNGKKYIEYGGKKYSHIIDPRTGYGVIDAPTVVVLGRNCWLTDIAASVYSILGKDGMEEFLKFPETFGLEFFEF